MLGRKSPFIVGSAVLVAAILCVASCAATRSDENIRLKTARAIGGVTSEQVTIRNLHTWMKKGATELAVSPVSGNWEAETPKGHYQCQLNDMLKRSVICVKQ